MLHSYKKQINANQLTGFYMKVKSALYRVIYRHYQINLQTENPVSKDTITPKALKFILEIQFTVLSMG